MFDNEFFTIGSNVYLEIKRTQRGKDADTRDGDSGNILPITDSTTECSILCTLQPCNPMALHIVSPILLIST